jgi:hypothetical protein
MLEDVTLKGFCCDCDIHFASITTRISFNNVSIVTSRLQGIIYHTINLLNLSGNCTCYSNIKMQCTRIYVFHVILTINSDYFPKQH